MNFTIRPVRPEDYEALAQTNRLAMPGTDDTAESLLEEDQATHAITRWVVEVDGRVIGSASWFQLPKRLHPHKFWMDGAVHPDYQGRGIGQALFDQVLSALMPKAPISLRTFSREDYANTLRFLGKHGFVEAKRTWASQLDLAAFDFTPYQGQPERVEASGIRLVQLTDLQSQPGWEERFRTLYNAIQLDVPDFEPSTALPMETFQQTYLAAKGFLPEGHFLALDGDRWVGLSSLWTRGEPGPMDIGLTGVLPEYRRRGIALALKLRAMAWARGLGVTRLKTSNASTNKGILAINERMGFVKEPAWIHLLRTF